MRWPATFKIPCPTFFKIVSTTVTFLNFLKHIRKLIKLTSHKRTIMVHSGRQIGLENVRHTTGIRRHRHLNVSGVLCRNPLSFRIARQPSIVRVNADSQRPFRLFLTDDVFFQISSNLRRIRRPPKIRFHRLHSAASLRRIAGRRVEKNIAVLTVQKSICS